MKKKLLSMLLVGAMSLSMLAGCGSSNSNDKTSDAAGGSSDTTATDTSGDAEYAVVLKTQATDFWVKMADGIQAKADELGIKVDIYSADNEEDTAGQLTILENCISKGYKGIAVAPLSSVNLISGIAKATDAGVTIVDLDEQFDTNELNSQGGAVVGFVTTDNVAVGNKGAQAICDLIEKGSDVAIIEGKAGNASGENRKEGATKAFTDAGMKIIGSDPADWDRQKALDIAASYIQQNPDLKGIYCCNDTMALGALQAVINADKLGEIFVVGTDGDTEALESVSAGQLTATVAQDPASIGSTGLEMLVNAVKDGNKGEVGVIPDMTPVDSTLITSDNVADFLK